MRYPLALAALALPAALSAQAPAARSLHVSGIGRVYARSDWSDDATWLRFECGDFWSHHQHFETGNFANTGAPIAISATTTNIEIPALRERCIN